MSHSINDSDDNDDTDDNIFNFRKKSFKKKRQHSDSDDDDSDNHDLQGITDRKSNKLLKNLAIGIDDDDDDSDGEVGNTGTAQPSVNSVNNSKRPIIQLDIDDSDDDSDKGDNGHINDPLVGVNTTLPSESILKARQARQRLMCAQAYHGEDVYIPLTPQESNTSFLDQLPSHNRAGAKLSVTIIHNQVPYPNYAIRKLEPLQKVVTRFLAEQSVSTNKQQQQATLSLVGGVELDLTKTPASCNIRGGECLLLTVKLSGKKPKNFHGAPILLKLRTCSRGKESLVEEYTIGCNEPFAALMEQYKAKHNIATNSTRKKKNRVVIFQFDGDNLNLQQTPMAHDMEAGDIIDVTVK